MALNLLVKIHPEVLFKIVNAYEGRNSESHRVIVTLLGTQDKRIVEVMNCFCVPHKEYDDQVEAKLSYASDVYDKSSRILLRVHMVTGNVVTNHSSVIHQYYSRQCNNCGHVTLDTSLQEARTGIKAYVCVNFGVPNGKQGCMFTPVNVEVTFYDPEVFGLQLGEKPSDLVWGRSETCFRCLAQISKTGSEMRVLLD